MTDYTVGDTLYQMFTTRAFATGIPTVLAGTPVVSAYENDSATQITAGITLGVSHDSVVGMNLLTIVATVANGYETGKDYNMVITTGTVDSVSVIGEVVGTFSLGRSAAAADLANGTDGLGAIKADTAATLTDTADMQPKLGSPAGASISADLLVIDNFVDGIETAVITNAAGVDIAADIIAVKAETATIVADTNELQGDDVPGLISTLDAVVDTVKVDTAAILVDTAVIGAAGAGLTDLGGMSTGMKAEVNAEADTAVADYDGPTNAEMVTRTLTAARITQLGQNLDNCFTGTASGTPTTTTMVSGIGVTVDDQFNGRIITFDDDTTTAAIRGQSTDITGCTAASNTLTFTALTTAPVSGDTFVIT